MKHILKNKSTTITLTYGLLNILPLSEYIMYDDTLNLYGNYFKSFKDNFTTELQEYFEYRIDETAKTLDDFYQFLVVGFNDTKLNDYGYGQNFYDIYFIE
jgi:hypothetical protein